MEMKRTHFLNWQQLDWWVHWVTYIAVIMNESKLLLFELGWGWDSYPPWISVTMRGYLPAIFRGWPMTGRKTIPVQWRHTRAHPLRWSTMSKDYGLETVYQSLLQYITLVHPAISMSELSELTWQKWPRSMAKSRGLGSQMFPRRGG